MIFFLFFQIIIFKYIDDKDIFQKVSQILSSNDLVNTAYFKNTTYGEKRIVKGWLQQEQVMFRFVCCW